MVRATSTATILRTTGSTRIRVGKATAQEMIQATGQSRSACAESPRAFTVEMPEMTQVISMDRISGITTAP